MPTFDEMAAEEGLLARTLAFGPSKSRKTWWAATAAEAGFNVLLLNGDDGVHIIKQVSKEARSRIQVVNARDKFGFPYFCPLIGTLLKGESVIWDDTQDKIVHSKRSMAPGNRHYILDVKKLTANDVLVLDSWTALKTSVELQFAKENKLDLSDASKLEWDGYGYASRFLDWVLNQLKGLPCHVVVIGHSELHEKKKSVEINGKVQQITEWTRMQPISSSRAHANHLAKHFSDVLFFTIYGDGAFYIDTRASGDRDGGSRVIAPKKYKWEDLSFGKYINLMGVTPGNKEITSTSGVVRIMGDEVQGILDSLAMPAGRPNASLPAQASAKISLSAKDGTTATLATPVKNAGLAGLLPRK